MFSRWCSCPSVSRLLRFCWVAVSVGAVLNELPRVFAGARCIRTTETPPIKQRPLCRSWCDLCPLDHRFVLCLLVECGADNDFRGVTGGGTSGVKTTVYMFIIISPKDLSSVNSLGSLSRRSHGCHAAMCGEQDPDHLRSCRNVMQCHSCMWSQTLRPPITVDGCGESCLRWHTAETLRCADQCSLLDWCSLSQGADICGASVIDLGWKPLWEPDHSVIPSR